MFMKTVFKNCMRFTILFFVCFIGLANANANDSSIFSIQALNKFPGTGESQPAVINPGESLNATYLIRLADRWPNAAKVSLKQLPDGMMIDTSRGCGANPILPNPQTQSRSCKLYLNYTVPVDAKGGYIKRGPAVCTDTTQAFCSNPPSKQRFNMQIPSFPKVNMLLKSNTSLFGSNGDVNNWFTLLQQVNYNAAEYGNGLWVIVGDLAADNLATLLTSTDGRNWTRRSLSGQDYLYGVFFNKFNNEWLAGGANGVLYHSPDGINYTRIKLDSGATVLNINYVPQTSLNPQAYWVVITGDTTNYGTGGLFISYDGVNWQQKAESRPEYTFISLAVSPQGNVVVISRRALWFLDPGFEVLHSSDGENWTFTFIPYPIPGFQVVQVFMQSIGWEPIAGQFLINGGYWSLLNRFKFASLGMQSTNAIGTAYETIAALSDRDANENLFNEDVVSNGNVSVVRVSNFGTPNDIIQVKRKNALNEQWVKQNVGLENITRLVFGLVNGSDALLAQSARQIYFSAVSNLVTWSPIANYTPPTNQGTLVSNGANQWLSVGEGQSILSSAGGLQWILQSFRDTSSLTLAPGGIHYSKALGQWLNFVENISTGRGISYSKNGVGWSKADVQGAVQNNDQLFDIDYSPADGKYLIVGIDRNASPNQPLVISSADGKKWVRMTPTGIPSFILRALYWNADLKQWLLGGNDLLLNSTDAGASWNPGSLIPQDIEIRGIAWNKTNKQYVVSGRKFRFFEVLLVGNNGSDWTEVNFDRPGWLRQAAWSPKLNLWVAVGFGGSVKISQDGLSWLQSNWAQQVNRVESEWDLWDVTWNEAEAKFIAVGGSAGAQIGEPNIVLYSADGTTWKLSTDVKTTQTSDIAVKQ